MSKIYLILIIIAVLAATLRLYRLDSAPPSISWDEAAVGYNAYSIANFGRDEYGKFFPAFFKSFGDDKHPVHIYETALSVKLLGLSEFSTRLPSAIFGVLNVVLIFFLARVLFQTDILAFMAAIFLAVSPYNIHFSRFNHEANFALAFFMLGLIFFFQFLKKNKYLCLSVLNFGIAFIAYHPSKVVVPVVLVLLIFLYGKQLIKNKKELVLVSIIAAFFFLLVIANPALIGFARINQTFLGDNVIKSSYLYKLTNNKLLGWLNVSFTQYSWHFSENYLFISGDKNSRLSDRVGEFYKIDGIFLLVGLGYLLYKRSKFGLVLLVWAFVAPIPSAMVAEAPHAGRSMYMMGSWHLISAAGFYAIFNFLRKPPFKLVFSFLAIGILAVSLFQYSDYYYREYVDRYAIDWQYGMKQIVEYVRGHPEYEQVFMTEARSQPYIFFLFYLKTPLPDLLNTVVYNRSESSSYSTVSFYDKYYFGGWDPIESFPNKGILYILTPSEYDGLRFRLAFDVKKVIYYPNNTSAYYLVSAK